MWFTLPNNINVDCSICLYLRINREPWVIMSPLFARGDFELFFYVDNFFHLRQQPSVGYCFNLCVSLLTKGNSNKK